MKTTSNVVVECFAPFMFRHVLANLIWSFLSVSLVYIDLYERVKLKKINFRICL